MEGLYLSINMTKKEKIEAAKKRIAELKKLILCWQKK